jgi:hypothetical protein
MKRSLGAAAAVAAAAAFTAGVVASKPGQPSCRHATVVVVHLDSRAAATLAHAQLAVRRGKPLVVHLARTEAKAHRKLSLRGIRTAPGMDRDEYPPAATREGGTGADVKLIPSADNEVGGSEMGSQLRAYCDGQAFELAR